MEGEISDEMKEDEMKEDEMKEYKMYMIITLILLLHWVFMHGKMSVTVL